MASELDSLREGICPNKCGKIILFDKPLTVVLPCAVIDIISDLQMRGEVSKDIKDVVLIVAACPKCGFHVTNTVSEQVAFTPMAKAK